MATSSWDQLDELRMDRTKLSVAGLTDPDDALEYWLTRPIEERLQALERLRRISHGDAIASARLQRVLEIAQLPPR
jgi:HAMP domain-containing protein